MACLCRCLQPQVSHCSQDLADNIEKRSAREDGAYHVDGLTTSHDGPKYGPTHVDLGFVQALPVLGHNFFCMSCTIHHRELIYEILAYTSISATPCSFSTLNEVIASRIGLYPGHNSSEDKNIFFLTSFFS